MEWMLKQQKSQRILSVSYTHLDVYKRQGYERWAKVFNIKQMAAALAYIQDNGQMCIRDSPEPEPKPTEPVEEVPEPEPEKKDSPLLSLLLIGAVVLAGGGIGYYFKIYKPKHEAPDLEDDYCEYEDGELEEIAEEPEDEDTPPWEEDTEE